MRIVDLSVPIVDNLPVDPPTTLAKIEYEPHTSERSLKSYMNLFPGLEQKDIPDGEAWAMEYVTLSTHIGTHIDAPWHFASTMNHGESAWTIDQMPLDWCIGDGVVVDATDRPDGYIMTPQDFQDYFQKIGYTLKAGDIVLLHTTAQKNWGKKEYLVTGCGVGRDATIWLSQQGVRLVGTDAWSWDAPLSLVAKRYRETHDPSIIWEGHKAGRECIYFQIEKLNNLDQIPKFGFTFCAFPIKIEKAGGGWCRAVAFVDE